METKYMKPNKTLHRYLMRETLCPHDGHVKYITQPDSTHTKVHLSLDST